MAHDLIIRNGTIIDGTGSQGFRADVAIDGDRITAIGDLSAAQALREIDASGLIVSPGFIDLHTHLDAQVAWDPMMTSSSWHGVTTVLIGNCGVTFAPVAPDHRVFLAEMMESVEDVPREAILGGLSWDWSTYPEYLDAVQGMRPALNIVGLVGHCAVRYNVMGERSLSDELPTPEELNRMRDIVQESIAGGAVGFSTSRILLHVVPDGRYVPGTLAPIDEYMAIADGMNAAGGGLFQAVNDFATKAEHEVTLLREMARSCGDVLFSGGAGNSSNAGVDMFGALLADTNANLGRMTMASQTRPSGSLCGLAQIAPVKGQKWKALMGLPTLADRVAALKDPATRAALVEEGVTKGLWYDANHIYPLGTGASPDYSETGGRSVATRAAELGVHPVDYVIDRLIASDGRELFNTWFFNRNVDGLAQVLAMDNVYPGLADTGAHAGQICDADMSTHYLTYWQRERQLATLPEAVRRLSAMPASVLGLKERGTLQVGQFADVNVFDIDTLASDQPTYVNDFPNGAGRLQIRARGYAATIVNGAIVTEQGNNTGERPGRVIREFARA
ncbi:MAG: amidohydrolase family protein [Ilumatobacteraceae bacterium]|nr:amidohydrolase family protein [Ilumatobacteraceae bacterium]